MTDRNNKSTSKKKKRRRMFGFISNTVDKVFSQVYDGEPVRGNRRQADLSENILEEEVLFCKNNICVHTYESEKNEEKHNPGYLCLKKIYRSDNNISDLMLSWVPNSLLVIGSTEEAEVITGTAKTEEENNPEGFNKSVSTEEPTITSGQVIGNKKSTESPLANVKDFETPLGDVFSVNLIDMKTVKLFYSTKDNDSGQFVIGSPENEYKVFHFHNTGLVKVTEIFNQWNGCSIDTELLADEIGQQVYYIHTDSQPVGENGRDLHPEEGRYRSMNMINWLSCINQLGQIEDGYNFRKHVFFGGLSQEVRPDAWKYLLYFYPMHSTEKERENMVIENTKSYEEIHNKRLALSGEDYENFWKKVQFTVDKDVVRTDRSHPYYAGQDNPNIQKMRNILLNYAIYNETMGYTQGMSDLVAPVLATLHSEVDSFWCFVGLMEVSMFATTPTDDSMDKSLGFLRELMRIMLPEFYMHCLCQDYDLNLLFAHRWLVLCFKREFIYHEVLKIWETCWARYQTNYFHIFICVALVCLYGDICLEKKMDSDEILQYFTNMANKFDGSAVLKEARSMLFKFRQLNRIPCTLRGLLAGKGVWDGGISPEVECASNHQRCCFEYRKKSKSEMLSDARTGENVTTKARASSTTTTTMNSSYENEDRNTDLKIEPGEMVITDRERSADIISENDLLKNTTFYSKETREEKSPFSGISSEVENSEQQKKKEEEVIQNVLEDERQDVDDIQDEKSDPLKTHDIDTQSEDVSTFKSNNYNINEKIDTLKTNKNETNEDENETNEDIDNSKTAENNILNEETGVLKTTANNLSLEDKLTPDEKFSNANIY